jgi:small subunit ribosomal protein S20
MPNKHAALKDLRKNRKRAAHNARIKTNVKALHKKSKELVAAGKKDEALTAARAYQQAVDKAIKSGVIHKNQASRKKSQVMKALAK